MLANVSTPDLASFLQWTTRRERGVKKGRLDGDVRAPFSQRQAPIQGNPFAATASKSTAMTVPTTTGLGSQSAMRALEQVKQQVNLLDVEIQVFTHVFEA